MEHDANLEFRDAVEADLPKIVALLADDFLGQGREVSDRVDLSAYQSAFRAITESPDNRLIVACLDQVVVGTFQLTFIPGLSFTGGTRAQIEAVRIDASVRGRGAGQEMIEFGIAEARKAGCCLVQLAMNKQRTQTLRFYQKLGFEATHEGFKYML